VSGTLMSRGGADYTAEVAVRASVTSGQPAQHEREQPGDGRYLADPEQE
jgi:hypothetical protein